jgi:thioredoxin-like negative regulator of GroEL
MIAYLQKVDAMTETWTKSDLDAAIAGASGLVIVEVSLADCPPCKLLRPVMRKLALQLADRLRVIEIDAADAEEFSAAHDVRSAPQLLCFRDGALIHRERGFSGFSHINQLVTRLAGVERIETTPADDAFARAFTSADAAVDSAMSPSSEALAPHIEEIQPALKALDAQVQAGLARGEIVDDKAANEFRVRETRRLYEPFQDKVSALRAAQAKAFADFEQDMMRAVDEYAASAAAQGDRNAEP